MVSFFSKSYYHLLPPVAPREEILGKVVTGVSVGFSNLETEPVCYEVEHGCTLYFGEVFGCLWVSLAAVEPAVSG